VLLVIIIDGVLKIVGHNLSIWSVQLRSLCGQEPFFPHCICAVCSQTRGGVWLNKPEAGKSDQGKGYELSFYLYICV